MRKFINGNYINSENLEIDSLDNFRVNNSWFIYIPMDDDEESAVYSTNSLGIEIIPDEEDYDNEHYAYFWCSRLTVVFENLDDALSYMKDYSGAHQNLVHELFSMMKDTFERREAIHQLTCIDNVESDTDYILYEKLNRFLNQEEHDIHTQAQTMKLLILNKYKALLESDEQIFLNL